MDVCSLTKLSNFLFADLGLFYYIDGVEKGQNLGSPGTYPTDKYTTLTIGRTNHAYESFGTFRMDHFVIFYKAVPESDIKTILQCKYNLRVKTVNNMHKTLHLGNPNPNKITLTLTFLKQGFAFSLWPLFSSRTTFEQSNIDGAYFEDVFERNEVG